MKDPFDMNNAIGMHVSLELIEMFDKKLESLNADRVMLSYDKFALTPEGKLFLEESGIVKPDEPYLSKPD